MPLLKAFEATKKFLNKLQAHNTPPGTPTDKLIAKLEESLNQLQEDVKQMLENKEEIPQDVKALIISAETTLSKVSPNRPTPSTFSQNKKH